MRRNAFLKANPRRSKRWGVKCPVVMSQGVITPVALAPVTKNVVTSFAMKEDAASSGYSGSSPASFGRYAHSHNFSLFSITNPRVYPRSKMHLALHGASWRWCKEVVFVDVSGFESRTQSIRRRRPTTPLPPNLSLLYNLWCTSPPKLSHWAKNLPMLKLV